jgi:hypothetical protein
MLQRWTAVFSMLFLWGCKSANDDGDGVATTVDGCKEQFSASKGYDYNDDSGLVGIVSATPSSVANAGAGSIAPDGTATGTTTTTAVAQAIADCQAAAPLVNETEQPVGPDCEVIDLMTHDAAVCSARALGLPEELGYTANIFFSYQYQRIIWSVKNTFKDSAGAVGGSKWLLDAVTGAIYEQSAW